VLDTLDTLNLPDLPDLPDLVDTLDTPDTPFDSMNNKVIYLFRMKEERSMTSIPQQTQAFQQILEEEVIQLAIERDAAMGM